MGSQKWTSWLVWLVYAGDVILLMCSVLIAYWIRFSTDLLDTRPFPNSSMYYQYAGFFALIGLALLISSHRYQPKTVFFSADQFLNLVRVCSLTSGITFIGGFATRGFWGSEIDLQSRRNLLLSWILSIILLTAWHAICDYILRWFRKRGLGLNHVLLIGASQQAQEFFSYTRANPAAGYNPLGILADTQHSNDHDADLIGSVDQLPEIIRDRWIDEVLVSDHYLQPESIRKIASICERADIRLTIMPQFSGFLSVNSHIHEVAGLPLVTNDVRILGSKGRLTKRAMDLAALVLVSVITLPLLTLLATAVALAIKIESRGPVLFRQKRIGKGGRPFWLYKFRSMHQDAEGMLREVESLNEASGPLFKIRTDPRVTRVGRVLRRYSIDELPQLYNVWRGHMSLVGPRPPLPSEVDQYADWQMNRFDVAPGIVGLPQVSGRSDLSFDDTIRLDLFYIENWSPVLDIKILLKTIPTVLFGRGAY